MSRRLAALLLAAAFAATAAPVAFVADIRGNATIEGDGKLSFLAEISPGTRLLLGSNATAAITFAATGVEFVLAGPGEFLVSADEVTAAKGAKPKRRMVVALADPDVVGRAAHTATASLRMRGVVPAGPSAPGLVFPVSTRIATLEPTMRWRGVPNEEYTLVLLESSGKELWKGRGKPEGTRPGVTLAPGSRYTWSVVAPGGGLDEAQFETLQAEAIGRVAKSRSAARTFPDRVLHALLLQDVGAQQEAREAWAELARERPDLPELAALAR
jgi:hypothetical protein